MVWGRIGSAVARHITEAGQRLELVGRCGHRPGQVPAATWADVIGLGRQLGFPVASRLSDLLAHTKADAVIHTTSSYFDLFKRSDCRDHGCRARRRDHRRGAVLSVVGPPCRGCRRSTHAAKRAGKTVLGTGVNPGFVMDALPLFLTGICQRVDRIAVTRVIDASTRRGPVPSQDRLGVDRRGVQSRMAAGRMGHVGLPESVGMVFDTLGKKLDRYESSVEPVVAGHVVETKHFTVQPGQVMGLKQIARPMPGSASS